MAGKEYIVFDFDHTLYRSDCTTGFHRFMLQKRSALYRYLPLQVFYYMAWKLSLVSTGRFKEKYLSFLHGIAPEELHGLIAEFWESRAPHHFNQPVNDILEQRIREGYSCVVITASPQVLVSFLVQQRYQIYCIGTLLDYSNNRYRLAGKNCKGAEKIARFETAYGTEAQIKEAYSDNASDRFLFDKAQHAFRIAGTTITQVK